MPELSLEEIARLVEEFEKLRKENPTQGSENLSKLTRIGDILGAVTLTGDQLIDLQRLGYSFITNDHIRESILYTELKREKDDLENKYSRLEARYRALVRQVESEFSSQFRLKDLIDKQRRERIEEG